MECANPPEYELKRFGSRAQGMEIPVSDLDVVVELKDWLPKKKFLEHFHDIANGNHVFTRV